MTLPIRPVGRTITTDLHAASAFMRFNKNWWRLRFTWPAGVPGQGKCYFSRGDCWHVPLIKCNRVQRHWLANIRMPKEFQSQGPRMTKESH